MNGLYKPKGGMFQEWQREEYGWSRVEEGMGPDNFARPKTFVVYKIPPHTFYIPILVKINSIIKIIEIHRPFKTLF